MASKIDRSELETRLDTLLGGAAWSLLGDQGNTTISINFLETVNAARHWTRPFDHAASLKEWIETSGLSDILSYDEVELGGHWVDFPESAMQLNIPSDQLGATLDRIEAHGDGLRAIIRDNLLSSQPKRHVAEVAIETAYQKARRAAEAQLERRLTPDEVTRLRAPYLKRFPYTDNFETVELLIQDAVPEAIRHPRGTAAWVLGQIRQQFPVLSDHIAQEYARHGQDNQRESRSK